MLPLPVVFYKNSFDNVIVEPIVGGINHVKRIDDLDSDLKFSGAVSRLQSQSYRYFGRTVSTLKKNSASLSYTFTGTGISLLGSNLAGARIDITVDGKKQESGYSVKATEYRTAFYSLRGLKPGKHTIEITLINDIALDIDAVEVDGEMYAPEQIPAQDIMAENTTLELAYGESAALGVKTVPENATERAMYTTSNLAVAAVTADGTVIANGRDS